MREAAASTERWRRGDAGPLDGVPVTLKELIASRGTPTPLGTAATLPVAGGGGRAAGGAAARGRRGPAGQDHLARSRHAVVGAVELPPARPQPVGPRHQPGRVERRCRGGGGRRLRAAACRHRHRRLGTAAGGLVRAGRLQAEPRPGADRPVLCRALRRADDADRGRRGAADAGAGATGPARRHQPAAGGDRLGAAAGRHAGLAHRADAGGRLAAWRPRPRSWRRWRRRRGCSRRRTGPLPMRSPNSDRA